MGNNYLQLDNVVLIGRTFAEYAAYFGLDGGAWAGKAVLDVGAGVSSFQAEALGKGLDVTSCDPIYGVEPAALEAKCKTDLEEVMGKLPAIMHNYNWGAFYKDLADLRSHRERAYSQFLKHYSRHRESYVAGSLPRLPFDDNAFDVSLVSYFLFLYDELFDYEFHRQSVEEMARVTRGEVRIYPLANLKGEVSGHLNQLMEDPAMSYLNLKRVPTAFNFIQHSTEMLVITKK